MVLYDDTVPQATQTIASTQPIIQANFQYLEEFATIDHEFTTDSTSSLDGFHKKVTFSSNIAPPSFSPGAGVLYSRSFNGNNVLAYNTYIGNFPITGKLPVNGPSGLCPLIGGMTMQWGSFNATTPFENPLYVTVNFPVAFTTTVYSLQLTRTTGSSKSLTANIAIGFDGYVLDNTKFTFRGTSSTPSSTVYWLAIGD